MIKRISISSYLVPLIPILLSIFCYLKTRLKTKVRLENFKWFVSVLVFFAFLIKVVLFSFDLVFKKYYFTQQMSIFSHGFTNKQVFLLNWWKCSMYDCPAFLCHSSWKNEAATAIAQWEIIPHFFHKKSYVLNRWPKNKVLIIS